MTMARRGCDRRTGTRVGKWLAVAAALLVPLAAFAAEPELDPARFEATTLVSGLTQPARR